MNSKTNEFLGFLIKVNEASVAILNKINYVTKINSMIDAGKVQKELVNNRKLLSEFSDKEEDALRFLTELFVKR